MARAQGAHGFGPVETIADLAAALSPRRSPRSTPAQVAVVDVRVEPGYTAAMTAVDDPRKSELTMSQAAATASDAMLVVDNIVKRFETAEGPVTAVDDVSFNVAPGEFLSIIGPSGCGKSTLFNIIGGLLGDYEGTVSVAGETIAGRTRRSAWCSRRNRRFPGAP